MNMNGNVPGPRHHRSRSISNGGSLATGWSGLLASQGRTVLAFAVTLFAVLYYITLPISLVPPLEPGSGNATLPSNLHLLIVASEADPDFCKALISAAIAGYPTPVILDWKERPGEPRDDDGGSRLSQIRSVHDFIHAPESPADEDVLVLVDGSNVWMQLRPQVLVDRFFEINRRADARIGSELGSAAESYGINQEIVFGSQKRCEPWTSADPGCYAVPESTLAKDIYGPKTDVEDSQLEHPFQKKRQRFLNSGVAVGTVKAMRKLFDQALAESEHEDTVSSAQAVLSRMFGEQEVFREMVRRDNMSYKDKWRAEKSGFGKKNMFKPEDLERIRAKAEARPDKSFDFGIGLDYGSEISLNTGYAEDDTAWLYFNDSASLMAVQNARGIPVEKHRARALQQDVSDSLPPFWTFSHEPALPRWTPWEEVQLLTNVYTGIVPAIVRHDTRRKDMEHVREEWWPLLWMQEYARILYDTHIYSPMIPVAVSGYASDSTREFWPLEPWKGGARNGPGGTAVGYNWLRTDDMCRDWGEELFRDGKGPWELPQAH